MTKKEKFMEMVQKLYYRNGKRVNLEFPKKLEVELNEVISEAIAEHEARQWTVCEKPDKSGNYQVTVKSAKGNVLKQGYFDEEISRWSMNLLYDEVIAFRELPAPYRE